MQLPDGERDIAKSLLLKTRMEFPIQSQWNSAFNRFGIGAKQQAPQTKDRTIPKGVLTICKLQTNKQLPTAFHGIIIQYNFELFIISIDQIQTATDSIWRGQWLASNGCLRQIKWLHRMPLSRCKCEQTVFFELLQLNCLIYWTFTASFWPARKQCTTYFLWLHFHIGIYPVMPSGFSI